MSVLYPLADSLPPEWRRLLADALNTPSFAGLEKFVTAEYASTAVYPPREELFTAFRLTPPDRVKAVILGQDPYHEPGQAHGLAFSVREGTPLPPSLRNIYRELADDLHLLPPESGDLTPWAEAGVLLLNTVLTVRAHSAASHRKRGWEEFTDQVITVLDRMPGPRVFILWGKPAQEKSRLISAHPILTAAHPSPLSAYRGFFGSRPFSRSNALLTAAGGEAVEWETVADFRLT